MPRNIRLQIEYDGSCYLGWQIQNSHLSPVTCRRSSIQGTIEKALRKILQEKIWLIGSGRTDAGVHALAQIANFKTNSVIPVNKLQHALNGILPEDIVISSVKEVSLDFHSRFQARSKIYCYSILNRRYPSALLRGKFYFYSSALDLKLMQKEAKTLLGKHDFKAFTASANSTRDTIRRIKRISIKKSSCHLPLVLCVPNSSDFIHIIIEADGFLYNMVRNIVGTLIEIGRGKMPSGSIKKILNSRNRKLAGPTAPACGLCLVKVKY